MDNICGIYKIECLINGKIYIGKSINIKRRFNEHISELNNNKKHNPKFINSWNKYGIKAFSFEIIEECEKDNLNKREIYWIAFYDSYLKGFNATIGGEGTCEVKRSDEWRRKQSIAHSGTNNHMFGVKRSKELIEKLKISGREAKRKLSSNDVIEIKKYLLQGKSNKELSEIYNISTWTIKDIKKLKYWKDVGSEFNEGLLKLRKFNKPS